MVPSFNIVCYSTFRVFTHSTVWWNQLNRLSNTKSVSVSKLKTNEISLLLFWMFFDATFSRSHVVFEISDKGEHGHNAHHVHHHPISERQLTLVMRLLLEAKFCKYCLKQLTLVMRLLLEAIFAKFCEISSILLCTHCLTCYEHKVWTYTSFQCLYKLVLNLLILKIVFDCCCFTVVRSYKHFSM